MIHTAEWTQAAHIRAMRCWVVAETFFFKVTEDQKSHRGVTQEDSESLSHLFETLSIFAHTAITVRVLYVR